MERVDYTNFNWCSWYSHTEIGSRTGGLENDWEREFCLNYRMIEIGQNTEKSPEDLWRPAVIQNPGEDHQLMLT